MKKLLVGLVLFMVACGREEFSEKKSDTQQFFENATRRDPSDTELKRTGYVTEIGCTTFFVENTQNRTILISARHCFNYAITNWCQTNGAIEDNFGVRGKCKNVLAADFKYDIAMYEAEFPYTPASENTFKLAAFSPKEKTRLQMTGFPADTQRQKKITTTENCWVLDDDTSSPYNDTVDRSARHNCTTWGGNSGGPMYLENTNIAIGLPYTYRPGDYTNYPQDDLKTSAWLAKMSDFVDRNKKKLEDVGVVIVDQQP